MITLKLLRCLNYYLVYSKDIQVYGKLLICTMSFSIEKVLQFYPITSHYAQLRLLPVKQQDSSNSSHTIISQSYIYLKNTEHDTVMYNHYNLVQQHSALLL